MLRIGVGASCIWRGTQRPSGWGSGGGEVEETGGTMSSMGYGPGGSDSRLAGVLEAAGGALIALGLATGPVGALLTGNMAIASWMHAPNDYFDTDRGYELPLTYALIGTILALTGPGRFSVDHLTGGVLNRPWMRAFALAGALASAAYLIATRIAVLPEGEDDED
jgi:putative oxidoreductase